MPPILVVSGLPGAGKSTTARELAGRLTRSAHVEADRLHDLIVSGAVEPGPDGIDAAAQVQLDLRLRNACLLARSFDDAGFTAVVDDIVLGDAVGLVREELAGRRWGFVMLLPDFEHVRARWVAMGSPFADRWGWIDDAIRHRTERIGLWLDTTDLGPADVVDRILERIDETLVGDSSLA